MSASFPSATLLLTVTSLFVSALVCPVARADGSEPRSPSPAPLHAQGDDADDQYNFIVGLAEKGFDEQVVKEARRFLEEHAAHPKVTLARYRLATALFDLGRADEARPHFARLDLEREFQFGSEVAFRLGQCELARGANEAAAEAFTRVLAGDAEYLVTPATFLMGEASFRQDDFEGAEGYYARTLAAEDAGDYARDAAHGLAWCAFRRGEHDPAVQRIEAFLRRWEGDERAGEMRFLLGESHLEAGRAEQALAAYGSVKDGPFHDAALRGGGFAAAALGRHALAAQWFEGVLAGFPDSRFRGEVALQRGIHLLKAGKAQEALAALNGADAGTGAETLYWRGRALAKLEQREQALAAFDAALRADPGEVLANRIQVARGDALFELGRGADAAAAYQLSGSDYALHAAAVAKLNEGEAEEAVRIAREIVAPGRESAYAVEAQLTLGEGLFALEQYGAAEAAFQVVARESTDAAKRARSTARMGWCRWLSDDFGAAEGHFHAVAASYPESAEADEARFMEARAIDAREGTPRGTPEGTPEGTPQGTPQGDATEGAARAARAYATYLAAHPDGAHRVEAQLRYARLEPGAAGEHRLRALIDEAPESDFKVQGRFDLAERLAAGGRFAEARPLYAAVANDAESDLAPAARYGLAWCLYSEEQYAAAAGHLAALGANESVGEDLSAAALELCVWAARKAGDHELGRTAFATFAARCADEPRRFAAAKVAAAGLRDAGRYDDAQALFQALLARTDDRAVALGICVERAYLFLDKDRVDEAEQQTRVAQRYAPEDPEVAEALFFVGEARFEAKEDARAAELYALAAVSGTPSIAARALYKGGFAALRQDRHDAAAQAFQQLVREYPASELYGESLFLLGEAHYRAERFDQTAQWLTRLRTERPKHETTEKALFRLGLALARTERWKEAADRLGELSRSFPGSDNLLEGELWRGRALAALDQRRGARQAFDRVVQGDRGVLSAQARIELGRLALAAGEREEALSEFLKVAVLYAHAEEVAEALFMAGQVLEAQKDPEKAIAQYTDLLAKHPETRFAERARQRLRALEK